MRSDARARGAAAVACAAMRADRRAAAATTAATPRPDGNGPVTLTWWHNGTADPLKGVWQQSPTTSTRPIRTSRSRSSRSRTSSSQTKIPLALQSQQPAGHLPAVGRRRAGHAGPVRQGQDITDAASSWIGQARRRGGRLAGRRQAVRRAVQPHVVGFWYRKDLFEKAGITAPPATMDELNAAVAKLKAAGIAPIAVGGKDRGRTRSAGTTSPLRECSHRHAAEGRVKTSTLERPVLRQGGRGHPGVPRHQAVPERASSARPPSRAPAARPAWSPTARRRWSCRATGSLA